MSSNTNISITSAKPGYAHTAYTGTHGDLSEDDIIHRLSRILWGSNVAPFGYRDFMRTENTFSVSLHTD